MDTERFCEALLPLAEKADEMPPSRHQELLQLLQQGFVAAFKETKESSGPGSREEVRLTITKGIKAFHDTAPRTNPGFFTSPTYHQQAALFLQELLQSLSGNSRDWFRELQLLSMETCLSIVSCIGWRNVRQCVPGVVSGTTRYISRSHLGKDSAAVRYGALDLLQRSLVIALSTGEDSAWVEETVGHLSSTMRGFLEPKSLVDNAHDKASLLRIRQLVADILASEAMTQHLTSVLSRRLLVSYMVVENMLHLAPVPADGHSAEEAAASQGFLLHSAFLASEAARAALRESVEEQRGVELLHLVTSLVRFPATRAILIGKSSQNVQLFLSVVKKCVRVAGAQMSAEDLYTARTPRRFPSGVLDECLECLAHALATLPQNEQEEDGAGEEDEETAGEVLTNALLDTSEAALEDWDLYAIHPPVIYVLTRLVTWQFAPLPASLAGNFNTNELPLPSDFVDSGAFEQLWSVVARPHLWDITRDEELCNYQQVHHRQVVAATVLRFLSVSATDVLAPAARDGARSSGNSDSNATGARSFMRFVTLTLYLVMEKAATAGIVREAAMVCAQHIFRASGCANVLDFFLDTGVHLVDDASRAVKESCLRPAAASVLRGAVEFAVTSLEGRGTKQGQQGSLGQEDGAPSPSTASLVHGSPQLPLLVRHRMSTGEVAALQRAFCGIAKHDVDRLADFVAATVQVACDCCRLATEEGDAYGTKAALALLKDTFDIAAVMNLCSPLEADDDEQERQTTSFNERVQLLQKEVREAILLVLSHCFASSLPDVAPAAIQAVVRGLLSFLTNTTAASWTQEQIMAWNEKQLQLRNERREAREKKRERRGDPVPVFPLDSDADSGEDDAEGDGAGHARVPQFVSPPLPWDTGSAEGQVVLQRSHLKTVYRAYLCFLSLLKEPVARFAARAARRGHRTGEERRQLEAVPVTPSFFAALGGIEGLVLLATDFLEQRMVDEVLPLALVWYEKASLPRIPTNTDERVKQSVKQFALGLVQAAASAPRRNVVREKCEPFFFLSEPEVDVAEVSAEEVGDGLDGEAAPAVGELLHSGASAGDATEQA